MSAFEFKLPDVGEGLSEGEIVRWHVAPGERVGVHESLVDVQTDKAIVEIPAPVSGVLTRLGGNPGDVLAVGATLAVIDSDETPAGPSLRAGEAGGGEAAPAAGTPDSPSDASGGAGAPRPGRVRASPAVRKLARERGVELGTVTGSGGRGQITREDVEAAAAASGEAGKEAPDRVASPPPSGEDRVEALRGLRHRIAQTMSAAWREVPHIFSMREVDARDLVRARESVNAVHAPSGPRIGYLPFLVQACAAALRAHPRFNASLNLEAREIVYRHRCNIGIATATPDGLLVTVVRDADTKGLGELSEEIRRLSGRARERKATPAELSGGTFTISNYGSYGGGTGAPIIRPPEVAIAGFGRVHDAVVAVDGQALVRPVLPLCVSTDHRLNDGEHLHAFMESIARHLCEPAHLLGRP